MNKFDHNFEYAKDLQVFSMCFLDLQKKKKKKANGHITVKTAKIPS